jgi:hypothetical protein
MNEWIMAGVIIGGTVVAMGGGSAAIKLLQGFKKNNKSS